MRLIEAKIKSNKELRNIILRFKGKGKKIAFTNGCFDILHYGHVNYLQKAKRLADILVVAINTDSSVKRIKGKDRPVINLKDRISTVAALESVDFVTSFNQDTPLNLIKLLKPDILVKGGDWNKNKIVGKDVVESVGGRVIKLPYVKGHSSSKIIKRIGKDF
ncbi:MAG: glycerol-3-phosphate cytidylyltransferase [Omnitrophica WOR_2 bacterium SM23_29]|nr:MAG: glycerol-3-phosphate cytidylyltransferase [Omnitrophica WOR_2 bacterium SM23_29]